MDAVVLASVIAREENQKLKIKRKILREKSNVLDLPEELFKQSFRVNKEAFLYILGEIEPAIKPSSIPAIYKLAATLRFLAEGSYQRSVGKDIDIVLARSTISKVINEILNLWERKLCANWIQLKLTEEEKRDSKRFFLEKYGLPGVVGCVDGTHVKIAKPHRDCNLYYNRKGYYSINSVVICDYKMKIRAVDAAHPGSSHDALIWCMSDARNHFLERFESGERGSWLLGDAGFALEPFLITPYKFAPPASTQSNFNKKHSAARNVIERTIGNLKIRFRCLLNTLYYDPQKVVKMFNVCCAIHNVCKEYNADLNEEMNESTEVYFEDENYGAYVVEATRIRDAIAQSLL